MPCDSPLTRIALRARATTWRWPPESISTGRVIGAVRTPSRSSSASELLAHRLAVDEAQPAERSAAQLLGAHVEVGRDVLRLDEGEVLVDHLDPRGRPRRSGAWKRLLDAVHPDRAVRGLVRPRHHLEQRGLAGAVVAEQGDDLAGHDVHVDAVEGPDEAVVHLDVAEREGRAYRRGWSSWSSALASRGRRGWRTSAARTRRSAASARTAASRAAAHRWRPRPSRAGCRG